MINIFNDILNNKIRYAGIDKCETNNGLYFGVSLYMQYCTHHCKGCHNKSTWDKDGGKIFTKETLDTLFNALDKSYIKRLTLSGGDPIDNINFSLYISNEFKKIFPNKKLWIYTGYTYEYLFSKYKEILDLSDYIIDGPFILEQRDITLKFRGSRNQKIWKKENNIWQQIE